VRELHETRPSPPSCMQCSLVFLGPFSCRAAFCIDDLIARSFFLVFLGTSSGRFGAALRLRLVRRDNTCRLGGKGPPPGLQGSIAPSPSPLAALALVVRRHSTTPPRSPAPCIHPAGLQRVPCSATVGVIRVPLIAKLGHFTAREPAASLHSAV